MELVELNAKVRETKGKGAARRLRSNNAIPAIIYGKKTEPTLLSLDAAEFGKIIRQQGVSGLFLNLMLDNVQKTVMVKEIQMDVFGKHYIHVDLLEIDMDKEMTVTIPVQAVGASKGVKEGGLLQLIRRELDVICKPTDRPETVEVDVSDMEIGDSIHVSDIDLGDDIKIPYEMDFTIVTVIPPTTDTDDAETEDEEEEETETTEETEAEEQ